MLYQTVIKLAVRRASGGPEPAWYSGTPQFSLQLQYMGWISTIQYPGPPVGCRSAMRNWLSCRRTLGESRVVNPMWDTMTGPCGQSSFWGAQSLSLGSRSNFKMFGGSSIDFHSEELHQWSCKSKGEVRTVPQQINASWIQRICDLNVN